MTPYKDYLVVFDGTSSYVINRENLITELDENNVEVLMQFSNIETAQRYCDYKNDEIIDKLR